MDKLSQRTGFAVEALSEFEFMVKRGGGTTADMEAAIRRLARSMGDARDGVKEAADAFGRLGLAADDLVDDNGELRQIDEILPMIADGMKDLQSSADRMDIAQTILGRGGTKLLPALQEGSDALREMREEMEKYGGAMSSEFSGKSAAFVDAQTNLANATDRLKEALAEPFLEPFTAAINSLAESIAGAKEAAGDNAGKTADKVGSVVEFAQWLWDATEWLASVTGNQVGPPLPTPGDQDNLSYPGEPGYGLFVNGTTPEMMPWYERFGTDPATRGVGVPGNRDFTAPAMGAVGNTRAEYEANRAAAALADSFVPVAQPIFSPKDYGAGSDSDEDVSSLFVDVEQDIASGLDEVMDKGSDFEVEMAAIGENFASNFSSGVGQAFADAIVYAEDFGDAMSGIFKQLMAQMIQQVVTAGLNSIFPGLGLVAKSASSDKVASPESKGGLPPVALATFGKTNYYAGVEYRKAYV
jgi:uncharacterized protein YukE